MIRVIILIILIFGAVGFIIYHLVQFILAIDNPKARMSGEKSKMKRKIRDLGIALTPIDEEELKLISLQQRERKDEHGFSRTSTAVFTTIYDEPAFSYCIKQFPNEKVRAMILVMTHDQDYFYVLGKDGTEIYLGDQHIGVLSHSGVLKDVDGKEIALIDRGESLTSHTVYINGREVGEVVNPIHVSYNQQRAYSLLVEMSKDETNLFLILTLLSLVEPSVLFNE